MGANVGDKMTGSKFCRRFGIDGSEKFFAADSQIKTEGFPGNTGHLKKSSNLRICGLKSGFIFWL
jgi:hypothetical protein